MIADRNDPRKSIAGRYFAQRSWNGTPGISGIPLALGDHDLLALGEGSDAHVILDVARGQALGGVARLRDHYNEVARVE
ncbi:MAG: hypothetical protein DMD95_17680 [Candidatus Rokuibacteriota bacterium]|nr:MAG: hypothetical protein DMD95_17680 [Candidatus Rokubacteria bacterium]